VVERVPRLQTRAAGLIQQMREKLIQHRQYVNTWGDDMPEVKNWKWSGTEVHRETTPQKEQE
jgi:xylulose-5-phosphate/fructose-6-phosphate phosphoketolase